MNKCTKGFAAILVTLISSTAPEDICESCLPILECRLFASMSRHEQQSWMHKYPCKNHHPDDYGTSPGSRAVGQGDYICCPNQQGVEPKTGPSSRLTDANRFGNPHEAPGAFGNQDQYSYYSNSNHMQNKDHIGANKDGHVNLLTNNKRDSDSGQNQNTRASSIEPTRWSSKNKNKYWNERPYKNTWDIGNQYFYHGNTYGRSYNNKRRNYFNNDQRAGVNNNYNNQGSRKPEENTNNNESGGTQYYSKYYPRTKQAGNSFGKPGQCDLLTRFIPDPQSECCGREATDDDRITDAPSYIKFAPAFNDYWDQPEELPSIFEWSYSMFKEDGNNTPGNTRNKTLTPSLVNVNNSTVVKGANGVNITVEVGNRISGGKVTELTQYPWTALLLTTFENGFQQTAFNCGGSLISSRVVLTAGHCVYDKEAVMKSVQVFLAEFDKRTFPRDCKLTGEGQKCIDNIAIYAEDVIRHPRFDETRLQNDIALVKLQTDVPYTDYIRPICLPFINIDDPEHARLQLTVAGWGRNGQYKSDTKQSTTVQLVPQHDCRRYYPDLTTRHLCAAGYSGEDTCKGDSGGPLMVLYRGKYYVVGVVSGKRTDTPCGSAVPSLYTNVYHYLDWIQSNIRS